MESEERGMWEEGDNRTWLRVCFMPGLYFALRTHVVVDMGMMDSILLSFYTISTSSSTKFGNIKPGGEFQSVRSSV